MLCSLYVNRYKAIIGQLFSLADIKTRTSLCVCSTSFNNATSVSDITPQHPFPNHRRRPTCGTLRFELQIRAVQLYDTEDPFPTLGQSQDSSGPGGASCSLFSSDHGSQEWITLTPTVARGSSNRRNLAPHNRRLHHQAKPRRIKGPLPHLREAKAKMRVRTLHPG